MQVPKILIVSILFSLATLFFMVSVISGFMVFLISTNFSEFTRTPIMSATFFIGFFLLSVCFISCFMVYRKNPLGKRIFTTTASIAIILSWLVVVVLEVVYSNEDTIGLFIFLTVLFLPLYFQLYLLYFHAPTRELFAA